MALIKMLHDNCLQQKSRWVRCLRIRAQNPTLNYKSTRENNREQETVRDKYAEG